MKADTKNKPKLFFPTLRCYVRFVPRVRPLNEYAFPIGALYALFLDPVLRPEMIAIGIIFYAVMQLHMYLGPKILAHEISSYVQWYNMLVQITAYLIIIALWLFSLAKVLSKLLF